MKSLILLLLILPALCFGRSVKIMLVDDFSNQTQQIAITDSKTKTHEIFLLKIRGTSIIIEDNLKELNRLLSSLQSVFGTVPSMFKKGQKLFPRAATHIEIERTAVFENWQVTFVSKSTDDNKSFVTIYLYKDDQFTPKPYK